MRIFESSFRGFWPLLSVSQIGLAPHRPEQPRGGGSPGGL